MDYNLRQREQDTAWGGPRDKDVFTKVVGKSGRVWLYVPDHADRIYTAAHPDQNKPGYRGFRGFGGATLTFNTTEGQIKLQGPWHANCDGLLGDTGVDLRWKHLTWGIVSKNRVYDEDTHDCIMEDVLHIDDKPKLGLYMRVAVEAYRLLFEKGYKKLYVYSESQGGSSCGCVTKKEYYHWKGLGWLPGVEF